MTEPREPEQLDDPPRPDTGNWYPVTPAPAEDTVALTRPAASPSEEATQVLQTPAPVVDEPTEAAPEPAEEAVVPVAEERTDPVAAPIEGAEANAPVEEPEVPEAVAPAEEPAPSEVPEAEEPVEDVAPAEVPEAAEEPAPVEAPEAVEPPAPSSSSGPTYFSAYPEEPTVAVAQPETAETQRLVIADEPVPVPSPAPADAIFRPPTPTSGPSPEPTRLEQLSEEEQKLAAERAARRDARVAALAAPAPMPVVAPAPVVVHKRTNDKFWGSLGLFLLRLVLAGIFAVRGLNILTDIPAAQAQFATTIIPEPGIMAIVTGVACELIALALLLGLLTRAAGLGIALIAGGALAFVYWGTWSVFVSGRPGFLGEYELLLATVGLLLLLIGGGGWSLDRAFRAGRERDKRERAATAQ
ncbi:hypothetical protein PROP_03269 [Propionicimonas sp. T2.31MG-18]|uniref:DoxX family membrane protein n=1 Tax=Propionicimonas sp. T2.31MG-18 TaxID=3157620 RepID=UPI0035E67FBA